MRSTESRHAGAHMLALWSDLSSPKVFSSHFMACFKLSIAQDTRSMSFASV